MIRTHGDRAARCQSIDLDCPRGLEFRTGGRIKVGLHAYGILRIERGARGIISGREATRVHLSCPLVFDVRHGTEVVAL